MTYRSRRSSLFRVAISKQNSLFENRAMSYGNVSFARIPRQNAVGEISDSENTNSSPPIRVNDRRV